MMQTRTDTVHIRAEPLTDRLSLRIISPPVIMPRVAAGIFTPPKTQRVLLKRDKMLNINKERKRKEVEIISTKACFVLPYNSYLFFYKCTDVFLNVTV